MTHTARTKSRGFSFTEVMFAVVLLGLGFIMLAAIFPVAIQQTQQTSDEAAAVSLAKSAVPILQDRLSQSGAYPGDVDGTMEPFTGYLRTPDNTGRIPSAPVDMDVAVRALWESTRGNQVFVQDPRFAWVPFVKRINDPLHVPSPQATVLILAIQSRTRANYSPIDYTNPTNPPRGTPAPGDNVRLSTLEPKPVWVQTTEAGAGGLSKADIIEFLPPPGGSETDYRDAVAEGTFVIISDAGNTADSSLNGRYYRVSTRRADLDNSSTRSQAWELAPGYDMPTNNGNNGVADNGLVDDLNENLPGGPSHARAWGTKPTSNVAARAYIVGRATRDPEMEYDSTNPSANPFEGPAQDVAIYQTVIPAN